MNNQNNVKNLGFDNAKYIELQYNKILERLNGYDKLYIEDAGKLHSNVPALRILPGLDPNVKTQILTKLGDKAEILFCISANEIEKNKVSANEEYSFENEILNLVDELRSSGLYVSSFIITLYKGQANALKFAQNLMDKGENVYCHNYTKGYPNEIDTIVSDEGYGENTYIKTTRPIVFVTSLTHGSGKLATCLSQLYHDYKNGVKSGFAKYETFPVWNLPLKHPLNVAYEAATVDTQDINMIDSYYFNKYNKLSVNYNKDIELFPTISSIYKKITGENFYSSPTEMGINMIAESINDDYLIRKCAKKEIIRRYFKTECEYKKGKTNIETTVRMRQLMNELDISPNFLPVVQKSKMENKQSSYPCIALELPDGTIVCGKNKKIISASGAVILNALRTLAKIGDDFSILPDEVIMPIIALRTKTLHYQNGALTLDDILVALSISAQTNEKAQQTLQQLEKLQGCEAHSTYILSSSEENTLKRLGINITCEPVFLGNKLFIK